MKKSFFQLTYSNLHQVLLDNDLNSSGANLLFNWHYKKKHSCACTTDLSKDSIHFFAENYNFNLPVISKAFESQDKTVKFLFDLADGNQVETVLIPFNGRYSICLSSQVGCAMKCSFCFTGTQGYKRNLSTDEIVGQYLEVYKWLETNRPNDGKILNIVYMGQGEPLHNFDNVRDSIEILISQAGSSVGVQKITVSTSGYLPGLKRWIQEMPGVNLALSLHSPFKAKRDELIPINKSYPVEDVLSFIKTIPLRKKQFFIFEYLLIKDFNDSFEDAHATAKLVESMDVHINLIPFNPFPGTKYKKPSTDKVLAFQKIIESYKVPCLIRATKGDDVLAACGQLKT